MTNEEKMILIEKVRKEVELKKEEINKKNLNIINNFYIDNINNYLDLYKNDFIIFYQKFYKTLKLLEDENNFNLLNEEQKIKIAILINYFYFLLEYNNLFSSYKYKYIEIFINKNSKNIKNLINPVILPYYLNKEEEKEYNDYITNKYENPYYLYNSYNKLSSKLKILERNKFFILFKSLVEDFIEYDKIKFNDFYNKSIKDEEQLIKRGEDVLKVIDAKDKRNISYNKGIEDVRKIISELKNEKDRFNKIFNEMENIKDYYDYKKNIYNFNKVNEFIKLYNKLNPEKIISFRYDMAVKINNNKDKYNKEISNIFGDLGIYDYSRIMYMNDDNKPINIKIYKREKAYFDKDKKFIDPEPELLYEGNINITEMKQKILEYSKIYKNDYVYIVRKFDSALLFKYSA